MDIQKAVSSVLPTDSPRYANIAKKCFFRIQLIK